MSKILTRDELLAARNFGVKEVSIPELDGNVYLKKWSGKDRAKFLQASVKAQGDTIGVDYETIFSNMNLVVAMSLCDESGTKLFSTSDEDIEAIGEMDAIVVQKIYEEALRVNALTADSTGEAAKN